MYGNNSKNGKYENGKIAGLRSPVVEKIQNWRDSKIHRSRY